ncbi:MAG: hypothetical protein AABW91_03825 [Nanoarchaeota archaeon]
MKKIILASLFIILLSFLVLAQEDEHNFTKTKQLIDLGISCNNLTNEQLEAIGDYYMEQMRPGEIHEYMDRMMGGEGSESLKQVHISIARRVYCNENVGGMMGGGMMGNYYYQTPQYNDSYQNSSFGLQILFYIILTLVVIIIILIMVLLINKSKNNIKQKRRK